MSMATNDTRLGQERITQLPPYRIMKSNELLLFYTTYILLYCHK